MTLSGNSVVLQYGQAQVRVNYLQPQGIIHADWVGVHSLVTIQKVMEELLKWFQETKCTKYLSDNSNIVGGWDTANDWLADVWTPKAVRAGMRYVAHVLAPGIYGQLAMEALRPRIQGQVTIRIFKNVEDAMEWLDEV
ncbi:hypothetical protein [Rufibacter roseus]|uniref:STAS/SEC14 domain-containing protein n=1 Tax=Rufibacter roseus TaxID=1567108 RepID=A0ABW2DHD8_9BACT|nr:hypothetical protein [Rufibacter roseus]